MAQQSDSSRLEEVRVTLVRISKEIDALLQKLKPR